MNYDKLKNRLLKNSFIKDDVEAIDKKKKEELIDESEAINLLKKLDKGEKVDLTSIDTKEWDELVSVIDESEHRLKKSIKFQLIAAIFEIPIFVVLIVVLLNFEVFKGIISEFTVIVVALFGSLLTHSFFILRIYQQGLTAMERFSEKRVGLKFLRIASKPNNDNNDFLVTAGTKMFLGHHVKPAEPLNSKDLPKK